ncbi:ATP-binding cassette domain-containing protein [Sorangium sp. So ce295]|uniref:carbohydrate-binding family 9-like protein n=1 Tax=Sorangium sp. So ce295 TaxID=3133295 RepID=UPI003F614042
MPVLTAHDLHKSFGPQTILDGISVNTRTGERVGLVGVNGSGKSTLARILAGLSAWHAAKARHDEVSRALAAGSGDAEALLAEQAEAGADVERLGGWDMKEWSAGLASAVALRGTLDDGSDEDVGYVVEAKIPWSSFAKAKAAPPSPGDAWRMNFYAMQDNGGAAWSPILGEGNFHRARRFGRVRFVPAEGDAGRAPSASAGPKPGYRADPLDR